MNLRRWFREHSIKLLAIRDTPEAIAGGVGIGVFFGIMPLIGLKTLLAIFFAWLTRRNIMAAVLARTAPEILFPLMPVIYRWDYDVGYCWLSQPHRWPVSILKTGWSPSEWWTWHTLRTVGPPLLLGSVVCSAPIALIGYFITNRIVSRHHRKKQQMAREEANQAGELDPP